jgi:serine/threonine-protein kinase
MVTGRLPFKSDSEFALMSAHLTAAPPPPISFAPDIPATLNDVILKSIAKDPAQRFQSAEEFRDALYNTAPVATQSMPALAPAFAALPPRSGAVAQEGPISAPPPNIPTRKNKWYVLAATVLMAAVGLSIAHWRRQGADPRKPLPPPKVDLQTAISNSQQPSIGASGGQTIQTDADGSAHDNDSNTAGNSGGTNSGISGTASAKDAGEKRSPADSTRQSVSTGDIQQAGSNEHRSPAKSRRTAVGARNVQPAGRMSPAAVVASDKPVESQIAPETRLSDTRSTQESLQSTPTSETQAQPQAKDQGSSAELKDRLTLLQLRAAPLRDSLQRMRAEQSSQGISMRQDISNAEQRMNHYLAEAAAALNQQSPDTKSLLDKAETAMEELEHFFGR